MKNKGFEHVIAINKEMIWQGINLIRTEGKTRPWSTCRCNGTRFWIYFRAKDEPTLYIIGDSVWTPDIEFYFKHYSPDAAIVFAGEAHFLEGQPITMGLADIENIIKTSPHTRLIISHMESWNHCLLKREEVRDLIRKNHLEGKISVPENGEMIRT